MIGWLWENWLLVATLFGALADQPILQVAAVALVGVLVWRFVIAKRQVDPT